MALPKKKSRPITVRDVRYRYVISEGMWENGACELRITIQNELANGRMLVVSGITTRNVWLDVPDIQQGNELYKILSPKHIAAFIERGLAAGWDSTAVGPVFTLTEELKT